MTTVYNTSPENASAGVQVNDKFDLSQLTDLDNALIARAILSDMEKFYAVEENRRGFQEWLKKQKKEEAAS